MLFRSDGGAGTVTVIDCGDPESVVRAFPAGSATEKDAAAVRVETTVPPPAVAVDVAVTVHTVVDVWATDEIAEIPAVSTKSVPEVVVAVVDRLVQSSWWLPVTVNVMVAEVEVAADAASVAVVGAAVKTVIESVADAADVEPSLPAASF